MSMKYNKIKTISHKIIYLVSKYSRYGIFFFRETPYLTFRNKRAKLYKTQLVKDICVSAQFCLYPWEDNSIAY